MPTYEVTRFKSQTRTNKSIVRRRKKRPVRNPNPDYTKFTLEALNIIDLIQKMKQESHS